MPPLSQSCPGSVVYAIPIPRLFAMYSRVGGHNAHIFGVVRALRASGRKVVFVAEDSDPYLEESGAELHLLPVRKTSWPARLAWSRRLVDQVAGAVADEQPSFCYMRYSGGFSIWMPRLRRRLRGVPWIVEVNSFQAQRHRWMRPIERRALGCPDLLVCVSESVRQSLLSRLSPDLADKILVVPNAVDVERFDPRPAPDRSEGGLRLGFTGLLKPDYGLEVLVPAFCQIRARHPDSTLHVYGDGPYLPALTEQARGEPGVHLHGARPFREMPGILESLDILLYTTSPHYAYQSPTKMYEYMAAARPIVAARTPQTVDLLGADERGLLYEIGDAPGLAAGVERLIQDPDRAKRLALAAREEVARNHTWHNRVERILAAVDRV